MSCSGADCRCRCPLIDSLTEEDLRLVELRLIRKVLKIEFRFWHLKQSKLPKEGKKAHLFKILHEFNLLAQQHLEICDKLSEFVKENRDHSEKKYLIRKYNSLRNSMNRQMRKYVNVIEVGLDIELAQARIRMMR